VPTAIGIIRRILPVPSQKDMSFSARGFPVADTAVARRLETVPRSVLFGFEQGADARDEQDIVRRLAVVGEFAEERRADLWSGLGSAVTFVGGAEPEQLRDWARVDSRLRTLARADPAALRRGRRDPFPLIPGFSGRPKGVAIMDTLLDLLEDSARGHGTVRFADSCDHHALLTAAIGGHVAPTIKSVRTWSMGSSIATHWRDGSGRVFVAGDAAHTFPRPAASV
jgi:2-polyprenyl-6-methoxyphenol hydroxylase-like FAD-dependent oxidoreductase